MIAGAHRLAHWNPARLDLRDCNLCPFVDSDESHDEDSTYTLNSGSDKYDDLGDDENDPPPTVDDDPGPTGVTFAYIHTLRQNAGV